MLHTAQHTVMTPCSVQPCSLRGGQRVQMPARPAVRPTSTHKQRRHLSVHGAFSQPCPSWQLLSCPHPWHAIIAVPTASSGIWTPSDDVYLPHLNEVQAISGAPAAASASYDDHRPRTPPPDLPSLLLDSRIVYLGMPVRTAFGTTTSTHIICSHSSFRRCPSLSSASCSTCSTRTGTSPSTCT